MIKMTRGLFMDLRVHDRLYWQPHYQFVPQPMIVKVIDDYGSHRTVICRTPGGQEFRFTNSMADDQLESIFVSEIGDGDLNRRVKLKVYTVTGFIDPDPSVLAKRAFLGLSRIGDAIALAIEFMDVNLRQINDDDKKRQIELGGKHGFYFFWVDRYTWIRDYDDSVGLVANIWRLIREHRGRLVRAELRRREEARRIPCQGDYDE